MYTWGDGKEVRLGHGADESWRWGFWGRDTTEPAPRLVRPLADDGMRSSPPPPVSATRFASTAPGTSTRGGKGGSTSWAWAPRTRPVHDGAHARSRARTGTGSSRRG